MYLTELTGVKRYKNKVKSLSLLVDTLKHNGYKILGQGSFSAVAQHPSGYAVKIFSKHDQCYLQFIQYCLKNKANPHLPKFITKTVRMFDDKLYMVRIEELEPLDDKEQSIVNEYRMYVSGMKNYDNFEEWYADELSFFTGDTNKFLSDNKDFFETVFDLTKVSKKCYIDFHGKNIMKRGNTLVFADAYWSPSQKQQVHQGF